jgi:CubicO group peptidase (beta-lactamase class C family)
VTVTTPAAPIDGFVAPGWEAVRNAFAKNWVDDLGELGAGVAVYHRGQLVVDLHGGWTDIAHQQAYGDDTLQLVFSTTKGITAIAVAICVQRGWLAYSDTVATHWPEFAANGKAGITVAQLLSHQAGLIDLAGEVTLAQALDWDFVTTRLAANAPEWEPGTKHGYHAVTYGWLAGELVRRVDPAHRQIGTFIAEEIANPLGAEFYVGLPEDLEGRVAPLFEAAPPTDPAVVELMMSFMGPATPGGRALFTYGPFLSGPDGPVFNRRDVHAAEGPAFNGIGSARSLARIYAATIGSVDGVRLLDEATRAVAATTVTPDGEPDYCLMFPTTFGMGFMTAGMIAPYASPDSFGHPGAGGSVAFASPSHELSFAYVMNQMQANLAGDARPAALIDAALTCIR